MTTEDTHDILFDEDPGQCPYCDTPFEFVRPGKSQPACDCQEPVEGVPNWQWREIADERNAAYRALAWWGADSEGHDYTPEMNEALKAARAFVESEKEAKE